MKRAVAVAVVTAALVGGVTSAASASALDPTFARNGLSVPKIEAHGGSAFAGMVRERDGGIVMAGFTNRLHVGRWSASGRLRWLRTVRGRAFGTLEPAALARRADGTIFAAGSAGSGDSFGAAVGALSPSARPVGAFGSGGVARDFAAGGAGLLGARAVAVDSLGRVVVGGVAEVGGQAQVALARLDSSGHPDTGFGAGGRLAVQPAGTAEPGGDGLPKTSIQDIAIQRDGRIVGAGTVVDSETGRPRAVVVRLLPDGGLDSSFGAGTGYVLDSFARAGVDVHGRAVALAGSKVVVAAGVERGARSEVGLQRLLADGSPDPRFGRGGRVLAPVAAADPEDLLVLPGGRLAVAGSSGVLFLAKYLADGRVDRGWGAAGVTCTDLSYLPPRRYFEGVGDAHILPGGRGRILLGAEAFEGTDGRAWVLARYRASFRSRIECFSGVEYTDAVATLRIALARRGRLVLDVYRGRRGRRVHVGRAGFGVRPAGAQFIHWNYRVGGRRVRRGTYSVVPRLLDARGRTIARGPAESVYR